jgi:hypothetical protein
MMGVSKLFISCIHFVYSIPVKDTRKPNLILGSCHTVLRREADILAEPMMIYNTSHIIKGTS